jgi:hypothetical protein
MFLGAITTYSVGVGQGCFNSVVGSFNSVTGSLIQQLALP